MGNPKRIFAALFCVLPLAAQSATKTDPLCANLQAFRNAPFDKNAQGKPVRRAIEFHVFGGLPGLVKCVHNSNPESKKLCPYLISDTSREFPEMLPDRILACYGVKFPDIIGRYRIRDGEFDLGGHANQRAQSDDRHSVLEVYSDSPQDAEASKRNPDGHYATRLSVIPEDEPYPVANPRPLRDVTDDSK